MMQRDIDVRCNSAARSIVHGVASTLLLMLLVTGAAAQSTKLKNVDLCNGVDRTSTEPQIMGCTALIKSGQENSATLVIAYNNRGNAYTSKGEYELAIRDYDEFDQTRSELRQSIQ